MNAKRYLIHPVLLIFIISALSFLTACPDNDDKPEEGKDIWDIEKDGIPEFVGSDYIELDKIYRISKFRSSAGHDYSDAFEDCRSMKHYFEPRSDIDWAAVKIYAPVTGTVTRVEQEWAGAKIEIASEDYPAFRFSIFHINLTVLLTVNDKVNAGDLLGTHTGSQTMSDISVIVNDPTKQGRMVSYFDVITDDLFIEYFKRGVNTRENMIIPETTRDANPLTCSGDTFISDDPLDAWVILD
jgi:hypothetical protein